MCLLTLGIYGGFSIYFTAVDFYAKFIATSVPAPCECVKLGLFQCFIRKTLSW